MLTVSANKCNKIINYNRLHLDYALKICLRAKIHTTIIKTCIKGGVVHLTRTLELERFSRVHLF